MTTGVEVESASAARGDSGFAIAVEGLGKEYRRLWRGGSTWALRDCTFQIPAGRVAALVGHNGAGKTTLLSVLAGLLAPTQGTASIDGIAAMATQGACQGRVSFVAQDKPLYRRLDATAMLQIAARFNRVWDSRRARRWLERFEIPLDRPCGRLSGGQQAQVSFALALGACPSVLLLDEPLANLDPLARREVTRELLAEAADTGMTVLLSTHVIAELGGVADYLLLLARGALLAEGAVDDILDSHRCYLGPRADAPPVPGQVVHAGHTGQQSTFLVRTTSHDRLPPISPPWTSREVTLEDFVLAHLENSRDAGQEAAA
ncbi:ABC transporter ATP-binding protein [Saccharopolyspora sp. 5N708]|uniref:ABC transporter ATP-binding protein n=1 Tax=Saccharopolyspora sp. 5N708 TaxID=3457424 RepID=UPI003FD205C9